MVWGPGAKPLDGTDADALSRGEIDTRLRIYEDFAAKQAKEPALADARVHVANVGMRWPEEVQKNVTLASSFTPPFDMARLPRLTAEIYRTEDQEEI